MFYKNFRLTFRICSRHFSNASTVDSKEMLHFKQYSKEWWDEMGQLKPLHAMNKIRIPLIRDGLISVNAVSDHNKNSSTPLKGMSIMDIGCGGGILSEPLSRIGGTITGLDANFELIEKAKLHAEIENLDNIQYVCSSIEEHAIDNADKYDGVVASEVIEHVTEKNDFLKASIKCLKPGGSFFLTTLNHTCLANFLGIFLAENILQIIPKGTHEYDKFISPHKLQRILEEENCKTILLHGMLYNALNNEWVWSNNYDIFYAIHAVKLPTK